MPDDWFSKKEEVPYLYLSSNPWACSCSLTYFHKYLNDYELNVYVRDGPNIRGDAESVVSNTSNEQDQQLFWPKTFKETWTSVKLGAGALWVYLLRHKYAAEKGWMDSSVSFTQVSRFWFSYSWCLLTAAPLQTYQTALFLWYMIKNHLFSLLRCVILPSSIRINL